MTVRFTPRKPSPPPTVERLAVSKKEAATMIGVSERSIDNWVKQGKITARKVGSRVLLPVKALQDFIDGAEPTDDVGNN